MLFLPRGQRSGASRIVVGCSIQFFDEVRTRLLGCASDTRRPRFLTSALAPSWYSTPLALIHHGQKFAVQLFPRNGNGLAGFQGLSFAASLPRPMPLARTDFVVSRLSSSVFAKAARSSTGSCRAPASRDRKPLDSLLILLSPSVPQSFCDSGCPISRAPFAREVWDFPSTSSTLSPQLFHSTNPFPVTNQPLLRNPKSTKSDHARRSNQRVRDHPRDERPENRR